MRVEGEISADQQVANNSSCQSGRKCQHHQAQQIEMASDGRSRASTPNRSVPAKSTVNSGLPESDFILVLVTIQERDSAMCAEREAGPYQKCSESPIRSVAMQLRLH
jgi:hypothetical protein